MQALTNHDEAYKNEESTRIQQDAATNMWHTEHAAALGIMQRRLEAY